MLTEQEEQFLCDYYPPEENILIDATYVQSLLRRLQQYENANKKILEINDRLTNRVEYLLDRNTSLRFDKPQYINLRT